MDKGVNECHTPFSSPSSYKGTKKGDAQISPPYSQEAGDSPPWAQQSQVRSRVGGVRKEESTKEMLLPLPTSWSGGDMFQAFLDTQWRQSEASLPRLG